MTSRPFQIHVSDDALDELRERLRLTRWPKSLDDESWDDGSSLAFMRRLAEHWLERFDWRAQEERLNRLPNRMMAVNGSDVHFVHQRGNGPSPLPLILTHGWPGSFIEMEDIIPLLADPGAHGGDPADAFDVVVPSLPGYGFSPPPSAPGVSAREIAGLWHGLMTELGYRRFAAQGGDIGAAVSIWLARLYPEDVAGIHLNFIPTLYRPALVEDAPPLTDEEQAYLDRVAAWRNVEGAYAAMHATKPQTLAFSLTDSPIGLAAWIAEKFRAWSDCDGDIERVVSFDKLLTDVSLYWFSDSLTASLRLYKENSRRPLTLEPGEHVTPPLGFAHFPKELPMPPRSWVERGFNVRRWSEMPKGGHFAALEQPASLASEIQAFFRPLRTSLQQV